MINPRMSGDGLMPCLDLTGSQRRVSLSCAEPLQEEVAPPLARATVEVWHDGQLQNRGPAVSHGRVEAHCGLVGHVAVQADGPDMEVWGKCKRGFGNNRFTEKGSLGFTAARGVTRIQLAPKNAVPALITPSPPKTQIMTPSFRCRCLVPPPQGQHEFSPNKTPSPTPSTSATPASPPRPRPPGSGLHPASCLEPHHPLPHHPSASHIHPGHHLQPQVAARRCASSISRRATPLPRALGTTATLLT